VHQEWPGIIGTVGLEVKTWEKPSKSSQFDQPPGVQRPLKLSAFLCAGATLSAEAAHARRGAADCGEYRQAAGVSARGLTVSPLTADPTPPH